jgi:hypothetical protein
VSLIRALVRRVAGLPSPDLRHRASPPSAVPRRRRRLWSSPWRLPFNSGRPGANPAMNGAAERHICVAPPLAVACRRSPPVSASTRGCAASGPPVPQSTAQISLTSGQIGRYRSTATHAPALDPSRRISIQRIRSAPFALTAPFCLKSPWFSQFYKNTLLP